MSERHSIADWRTSRVDMSGRAKTSIAESISVLVGIYKDKYHDWLQLRTNNAAVTDSSHRSSRNSSSAIDSLSTLIMRWHSCGRKNSISS
jgi:hypothetical protein